MQKPSGIALEKKPTLRARIWAARSDYLLMAPYLLFFTVFIIAPVVIAIALSFTQYNMIEPARFIGLGNYVKMLLDDDVFLIAFQNTLLFGLVVGPISYVMCFIVAWMISGFRPMVRSFITAVFYIPTIVGAAGWTVWRLVFNPDQYGILNGLLMNMGFLQEPVGWLVDKQYIMPVLIVVQLWLSMGISFLTFVAGIQNIDKTLYEAGFVDGIKNRFQELWYITLPSMVPQLVFGAVMQIVSSFTVADVSIELAGFPSTSYAGETMATHIMDYGDIRFEFGYACAMATMLVLVMVALNKVITKLLSRLDS